MKQLRGSSINTKVYYLMACHDNDCDGMLYNFEGDNILIDDNKGKIVFDRRDIITRCTKCNYISWGILNNFKK